MRPPRIGFPTSSTKRLIPSLALVRAYLHLAVLSAATVCAAAVLRGVACFPHAVRSPLLAPLFPPSPFPSSLLEDSTPQVELVYDTLPSWATAAPWTALPSCIRADADPVRRHTWRAGAPPMRFSTARKCMSSLPYPLSAFLSPSNSRSRSPPISRAPSHLGARFLSRRRSLQHPPRARLRRQTSRLPCTRNNRNYDSALGVIFHWN